MKLFQPWHKTGAIVLALIALLTIYRAGAVAQAVKAALVRDVDAPALAPFRVFFESEWTAQEGDMLVTTVPPGKRLVIEHVSYGSSSYGGDQLVYGDLRNGHWQTAIHLEIHPPHATALSGYTLQDGSQAVKAYFDPGTEVWLRVLHTTTNSRDIHLSLNGYYVTL